MRFLRRLPWGYLLLAAATIGLAPFRPPHVWEKLQMLATGTLSRPIDIFDLALHGAPWLLLALKAIAAATAGRRETS